MVLCYIRILNRFDRTGLGGTHSVRDEEVLSVDPAESVPLTNFMQRVVRPRPPPQPQPQPYASVFASPVKGGVGGGGLSAGRPVTSTFFLVFFLVKNH